MQYRHGDVGIQTVKPPARKGRKKLSHLTLAEGEVTGHSHRVVDASSTFTVAGNGQRYLRQERPADAVMYEQGGLMFLMVRKPAVVVHQEHGAIDLPRGTYQIRQQREWSPEGERRVID